VAGVSARCGLWVTRYRAPRGGQDGAVGLCDAGDAPAPRAHTGSPCASVDGAHPAIVTRIVSGGIAREAQCDLVGRRAFGLAGPVRALESPRGARAKGEREAQEGGDESLASERVPQTDGTASG
jgi:hypothetical protein